MAAPKKAAKKELKEVPSETDFVEHKFLIGQIVKAKVFRANQATQTQSEATVIGEVQAIVVSDNMVEYSVGGVVVPEDRVEVTGQYDYIYSEDPGQIGEITKEEVKSMKF